MIHNRTANKGELSVGHVYRQDVSHLLVFHVQGVTLLIRRLRRSVTLLLKFQLIQFSKEVMHIQVLNSYHSNNKLRSIRLVYNNIRVPLHDHLRTVRTVTTGLYSVRVSLRGFELKVLLFRLRKGRRFPRFSYSNVFQHVMLYSQVVVLLHLRSRRIFSVLLNGKKATLVITLRMYLSRHTRRALRVGTTIDRRSSIFAHCRNLLRMFKGLLRQRSFAVLVPRFNSFHNTVKDMRNQLLQRTNRVGVGAFSQRQQGGHLNSTIHTRGHQ